jgi:crotonobetainyl-CoA:carnitine CoA-transferase CaiB-like acyl-CoA transferase
MTTVDVLSGLYLYSALTTALARRRRTGQGGYLDINLMQSAAAFQAAKIMEFHLARGAPKPLYMPAGHLRTKDGAVSLSTMRQAHYEALCHALGRSDLITDPRFAEIGPRIENGRTLMGELEGETSCRDTCCSNCCKAPVCSSSVRSPMATGFRMSMSERLGPTNGSTIPTSVPFRSSPSQANPAIPALAVRCERLRSASTRMRS